MKWIAILIFVASGLIAAAIPGAAETSEMRARAKMLDDVRHWGCQYQRADKEAIKASPLDLIVVDQVFDGAFFEADDVRALKSKPDGSKRLVFAYLSVGEAENYRHYWQPEWSANKAAWLGPINPNWPTSYHVRFWHEQWQKIVFRGPDSFLDRILGAGFDGVFLDRVDAFWDWRKEKADAKRHMVDLVEALAAKARSRDPAFLIIGQNAEPMLQIKRYRETIDAVSKEVLLYSLKAPEAANAASDVQWSLNHLKVAQNAGLKILTIEYLSDAKKIAIARQRHEKLGFIPFFGNRALDRLPGAVEAEAIAGER